MKLTKAQSDRFYRIFDSLLAYAGIKLDLDAELFAAAANADPQAQTDILDELWQERWVIDCFVDENPYGLSEGDLSVASLWKRALQGRYFVRCLGGHVFQFMAYGYVFEVCGITQELDELIGTEMVAVDAVLLPFEGRIIYGFAIRALSIDFSTTLTKHIDDEFESAVAAGKLVRTSEEFEVVLPRIEDARVQDDLDAMLRDLEGLNDGCGYDDEPDADESDLGTHKGALAGLSTLQRRMRQEQQVLAEADTVFREQYLKQFSKYAVKLPEQTSMHALLSAMSKDDIIYSACLCGCHISTKLRKAQVVEQAEEFFLGNREVIENYLDTCMPSELEALRELVMEGGMLAAEDLKKTGVPLERRPCVFSAVKDKQPLYIVPQEFVPAFGVVDWEDLLALARKRESRARFADAAVGLRGVVPVVDLFVEWALFQGVEAPEPDSLDVEYWKPVLMSYLSDVIRMGDGLVVGYEYCSIDGMGYLADSSLLYAGWSKDDLMSLYHRASDKAEPRPVTQGMLDAGELHDWKCELPECVAFRDFIDLHVPDGADDYFFADDILDTVIMMSGPGARATEIIQELVDRGIVLSERELKEMLDKLVAMLNALPSVENNGWSPNQMLERSGMPVRPSSCAVKQPKIGRNDPCPCGSGKKYKKCCGAKRR